jgi:hypothetical protein
LFSEQIPVFGFVPMVFYMPHSTKADQDFIMQHGGLVSNQVECFTIQLFKNPFPDKPIDVTQIPTDLYQPGMVINHLWLIEMASRNERISSDPFRLRKIEPPSLKDHSGSIKLPKKNSGPRTRFTLRELIKIFKVVQEYPSKKNKNQVYW